MSVLQQNEKVKDLHTLFSQEDNEMWAKLNKKQSERLEEYATPTFLSNLKKFNLPSDRVPTLSEISAHLYDATGWQVSPVKGLIDYNAYFSLLQQKLFPAAMFMRTSNEEDLCKDPDLFHEVFGHCTMLLSQEYADFMQNFAKFALTVAPEDRPLFSRLIWFTTETALIRMDGQLKIFGSSILSSYEESFYAINNAHVIHKPFSPINIFREPYRADILQKVYYVLDNSNQIYNLLNDIPALYQQLDKARKLGEFEPMFEISHDKYSNIGHCKQREPELA